MSETPAVRPATPAELDRAAARALELTSGAAVIGLGSGRAATSFIRALGAQVKEGRSVRGVPTSEATARLARELGIPLVGLDEASPEVTVDGADEVDPRLDMIKGYGGALVRERIVAESSGQQIILVGPEKLVPVLGSHGRLPIEVVPFALALARGRLAAVVGAPALRTADGRTFVTDNGNVILDCALAPIADSLRLEREIRAIRAWSARACSSAPPRRCWSASRAASGSSAAERSAGPLAAAPERASDTLTSGRHRAEPRGEGCRVKMQPGLETLGHRFAVDMGDEIAIVRHPQGRFGLLVGQEPYAARRTHRLLRRSDLEALALVQVDLRRLPNRFEGVRKSHNRGIALDDGSLASVCELLERRECMSSLADSVAQPFHTSPSRSTIARNPDGAVRRSTMSTSYGISLSSSRS